MWIPSPLGEKQIPATSAEAETGAVIRYTNRFNELVEKQVQVQGGNSGIVMATLTACKIRPH